MNRGLYVLWVLAICALGALLDNAAGQDAKEQIRGRMKERYPALVKAKSEGKIGETAPGLVEIIAEKDAKNETLKKLVEAENADRKQLYEMIAKDTKTSPEVVGKQNALRIFEKAEGDENFKGEDGKWRQKKDLKTEDKKQ